MSSLYVIAISRNTGNNEMMTVSDELTDNDLESLGYEGCKKMCEEYCAKHGHSYITFLQGWDDDTLEDGWYDNCDGSEFVTITVDENELAQAMPILN